MLAIKYLKQYRYDTILMVSDEENEQRMKLIIKGSTEKSKMTGQEKNSLEYHYQMVRLMATCCIGENQLVKSFCQNIFDTNEIFEVLLHNDIATTFKQCYCLYLVWAHFNDYSSDARRDFQLEESIWTFIQITMKDLRAIFERDLQDLTKTNEGRVSLSHVYDSALPLLSSFYDKYYFPDNGVV